MSFPLAYVPYSTAQKQTSPSRLFRSKSINVGGDTSECRKHLTRVVSRARFDRDGSYVFSFDATNLDSADTVMPLVGNTVVWVSSRKLQEVFSSATASNPSTQAIKVQILGKDVAARCVARWWRQCLGLCRL